MIAKTNPHRHAAVAANAATKMLGLVDAWGTAVESFEAGRREASLFVHVKSVDGRRISLTLPSNSQSIIIRFEIEDAHGLSKKIVFSLTQLDALIASYAITAPNDVECDARREELDYCLFEPQPITPVTELLRTLRNPYP